MQTPEETRERARQGLARLRAARGAYAPTLGWLFGDTPGAPSPDDGTMAVAPVLLAEWARRLQGDGGATGAVDGSNSGGSGVKVL